MRRWEIVFSLLFVLAAEGCASLAKKIRRACFL